MVHSIRPILSLTAGEIMSAPLVVIPEEMSLKCAAHVLTQANVGGAPVVNRNGRCIGVLSSTDFVKWVDREATCEHSDRPSTQAVFRSWEIVDIDELPNNEVRGYMTVDPVTALPGTTVGEVARMMIDAHIHRIVVVDGSGRPIGMISSTDLLAVLARACQAAEHEPAPEHTWREPLPCSS